MTSRETVLVCPKCQKTGLVRLEHANSEDIFECVYCHHEENLSAHSSAPQNIPAFLLTTLLAIWVALFMLM